MKAWIAIDVLTGKPAQFEEGFAVSNQLATLKHIVDNSVYSDGGLCYRVEKCEIILKEKRNENPRKAS